MCPPLVSIIRIVFAGLAIMLLVVKPVESGTKPFYSAADPEVFVGESIQHGEGELESLHFGKVESSCDYSIGFCSHRQEKLGTLSVV